MIKKSLTFIYFFTTLIFADVEHTKNTTIVFPQPTHDIKKNLHWKLGDEINEYIGNHVYDPKGKKITYSVSGLPTGLYFDNKKNIIYGKTYQEGLYPLVVFAGNEDSITAYIIEAIAGKRLQNESPLQNNVSIEHTQTKYSYPHIVLDKNNNPTTQQKNGKNTQSPTIKTKSIPQAPKPKKTISEKTSSFSTTSTDKSVQEYKKPTTKKDKSQNQENSKQGQSDSIQNIAVPPTPPQL